MPDEPATSGANPGADGGGATPTAAEQIAAQAAAAEEKRFSAIANSAFAQRAAAEEKKHQKAIAAQREEMSTSFEQKLAEREAAWQKTLDEKLAALVPKPPEKTAAQKKAEEDAKAAAAGAAHQPAFNLADSPEWKAIQEELAAAKKQAAEQEKATKQLTKANEEAERARKVAVAKQRDQALRAGLTEALTAAGVPPQRARVAVGYLADSEKIVGYAADADDAPTWRNSDDERVSLAEGVAAWLKTDTGKDFLPPKGANGSGARPGASGAAAPGKTDPIRVLAENLGHI